MPDSYRTVTAIIRQVRRASIMVESRRGWQPIPRSLIHGADEFRLDRLCVGDDGIEHTFRLFAWKAEEIGLT
jgi:hypothetical protein